MSAVFAETEGATKPVVPSLEEIKALVRTTTAKLVEDRSRALGERTLAWLALVPVWTVKLALRAGFPTPNFLAESSGDALLAMLDAAAAGGLVEHRPPAQEDEEESFERLLPREVEHHFWMPEPERAKTLADLRERSGATRLQEELNVIVAALTLDRDAPNGLENWLPLAKEAVGGLDGAARFLEIRLDALLPRKAGTTLRTGEALESLRHAEMLALALGGELDLAVIRAYNAIASAYRLAHDRRALEGFIPRTEQIAAFRNLLEKPSGPPANAPWAIHFLGIGGVGKTMLVRHITSDSPRSAATPRRASISIS